MKREDFFLLVYETVGRIPEGYVTTYGRIAALIGYPGRARMVGQAMSHAPDFFQLPCHRVVASDGRLAPGFFHQRERLLEEGVPFRDPRHVELADCLWDGNLL